ncbi:short chain dehydrogenase [uncultured Croceitalea sp.]|uniref:short chain dehydrogenase n=1 Tax=uncultured Croceitalea sp. TaxID=1798908 RepID=UPI0033063AC3
MKIVIVGGNGTIGKSIAKNFSKTHEVITAGRNNADLYVDITKSNSIKSLFDKLGKVDAVIGAAGEAKWADFKELSEEDYYIGFKSKLMGQVNLVRIGQNYLNPNGSFTLTTGILADNPVIKTSSAAMVNGAIHSFVKAVALELENGMRVNAVSAGTVEEAYDKYKDYFPGHLPVPMKKVVAGYEKSVLGKDTGRIFRIYE